MPKVLSLVLGLAFLIATNVSAVEPQGFVQSQNPTTGFVLKGAFVDTDGSIKTLFFPGDGEHVVVFNKIEDCDKIKAKVDEVLKKTPDVQYMQLCIPTPKGLTRGLEKRPEA